MNLAQREQTILLLQSNIKKNQRLLKNKLLNMKGGNLYEKWKTKYDECINQRELALEQMRKLLVYLEKDMDLERVQFARENIKKQIDELEKEIDEMKISE